jgi:hypothetical protein
MEERTVASVIPGPDVGSHPRANVDFDETRFTATLRLVSQ